MSAIFYFSIIILRFIHDVVCRVSVLPFITEYYSIIFYHNLFIYSTAIGYLGCFQVGLIINKASINSLIQVLDVFLFLLGKYLEVELLDHEIA